MLFIQFFFFQKRYLQLSSSIHLFVFCPNQATAIKTESKKMFAWLSNGTMCGGCVANLFRRINTEETYIEAQFINVLAISVRIHYVC